MAYDKARQMELLEVHEGWRNLPYRDTVGKLTIGVGFNLDDEGLYDNEIDYILNNRVEIAVGEMQRAFPVWNTLCAVRKIVLIDMLFNLGLPRLRSFKRMWSALHKGHYTVAAKEMLDSKWAGQVGVRATRLAEMMQTGDWPTSLYVQGDK